jgi:putative sterol carrier protein
VSRLAGAARRFVDAYHARAALVAEQAGWRCVIALRAIDGDGESVTVRVDDGRVTDVAAQAGPADLEIAADTATLEDVLERRRSPNEPYLFGELTVRGRSETSCAWTTSPPGCARGDRARPR